MSGYRSNEMSTLTLIVVASIGTSTAAVAQDVMISTILAVALGVRILDGEVQVLMYALPVEGLSAEPAHGVELDGSGAFVGVVPAENASFLGSCSLVEVATYVVVLPEVEVVMFAAVLFADVEVTLAVESTVVAV